MLDSFQTFIQRRWYTLMMLIIGVGFVTLIIELLGYQHWEGFQLIGLSAIAIGAIVSFVAIGASASLRKTLGLVFLVLALVGLIGTVLHNGKRLTGQAADMPVPPPAAADGQAPAPGEGPEGGRLRMPPPPLAPLSMSGFCILGAVVVLGRREE